MIAFLVQGRKNPNEFKFGTFLITRHTKIDKQSHNYTLIKYEFITEILWARMTAFLLFGTQEFFFDKAIKTEWNALLLEYNTKHLII